MIKFIIRRLLWLDPGYPGGFGDHLYLDAQHAGRSLGPRSQRPPGGCTTQAVLNEYYGLDKPLWRQFMGYLIGDTNSKGKFMCGAGLLEPGPILPPARCAGAGYSVQAARG